MYKMVLTAAAVMALHGTALTQVVVQPAPATSASAVMVQQQAQGDVLRAGAPVPVALQEHLTTKGKRLKVGQRVQLEVAQDVLHNGRVVIPARSPVEGVLTEVRNKGMWGKSGGIHLQMTSVSINGTKVRLKGDMDSRGETGTAGVVGALVVLPVAGFFVTGTSAEMPLNMPGRAFLDQDIMLAPLPTPAAAPLTSAKQ